MLSEKLIASLMQVTQESEAGMGHVVFGRDKGDSKCEALFYIAPGDGAVERVTAIEEALDEVDARWDEEDGVEGVNLTVKISGCPDCSDPENCHCNCPACHFCPSDCDCGCPDCGCEDGGQH